LKSLRIKKDIGTSLLVRSEILFGSYVLEFGWLLDMWFCDTLFCFHYRYSVWYPHLKLAGIALAPIGKTISVRLKWQKPLEEDGLNAMWRITAVMS